MWESRYESDYLMHHGVKGMPWGVRRYQNEDGTYTNLGKRHYGVNNSGKSRKQLNKERNKMFDEEWAS